MKDDPRISKEIKDILELLDASVSRKSKGQKIPDDKNITDQAKARETDLHHMKSAGEISFIAEYDKISEENVDVHDIGSEIVCLEELLDNDITESQAKDVFLEILSEPEEGNSQKYNFEFFAARPHDKMSEKIAYERKNEENLKSCIIGTLVSVWIIMFFLMGLLPSPPLEISLESYYEWKVRMSDDELFKRVFAMRADSKENKIPLGSNTFSLASSSPVSPENTFMTASFGVSDNQPRVQRALRILSTASVAQGGLSSGDASIQDLLADPSSVSLLGGSVSSNQSLGSVGVMTTVGSDTGDLSFISAGGELTHSTRVELSYAPVLTGDPQTVAQRSNESVNRVITRNFSSVQHLFNSAREINPNLSGKAVVSITIASNGDVMEAALVSSTLNDGTFERKIIELVGRWRFPSLEDTSLAPVTVTVPFNFIDF